MRRIIAALALMGALCVATVAGAAVNVNTANKDQLTELKGIGPVTAGKIVADRKAHGQYESVDDLTRVKGIGTKTVDDLRADASVDNPPEDSNTD